MKKVIYLLGLVLTFSAVAQQLNESTTSFTFKFQSYVTLVDGTELVGAVGDMDKKAGLMSSMQFRVEGGKKRKLKPEDIASMYLAPYDMVKASFAPQSIDESKPWNKTDLNKELINKGYVYFENITIKTKNKTKPLLAQLLNPGFSSKVKIYYDPWNGAAIDPRSDFALSYYIMKNGDEAASEIKRKNYEEKFASFWDCAKVEEIGADWSKLLSHATTYATECE